MANKKKRPVRGAGPGEHTELEVTQLASGNDSVEPEPVVELHDPGPDPMPADPMRAMHSGPPKLARPGCHPHKKAS